MDETAEASGTLDGTAGSTGSGSGTTAASGTTSERGETSGDAVTSTSSGSTGSETGGGTGFDPGVACPSDFDPVCGEDGNTYDNACAAGVAGVEIRREGPCFGDCEGSCVVAPRGPSLVALALVVLVVIRPRRPRLR